jgi:hypothetical protein
MGLATKYELNFAILSGLFYSYTPQPEWRSAPTFGRIGIDDSLRFFYSHFLLLPMSEASKWRKTPILRRFQRFEYPFVILNTPTANLNTLTDEK